MFCVDFWRFQLFKLCIHVFGDRAKLFRFQSLAPNSEMLGIPPLEGGIPYFCAVHAVWVLTNWGHISFWVKYSLSQSILFLF